MATKKKIVAPAVKEKNGKVDIAPSFAWAHDTLEAVKKLKKSKKLQLKQNEKQI